MAKGSRFTEQINSRTQAIADLEALHSNRALDLVNAPGDAELQAELTAIESEIADHRRAVERLRAAESEHKRRNSKAARNERAELMKVQHARLVKTGATAEKLAAKIQSTLDSLTPLLTAWNCLVEDRCAETRALFTATKGEHSGIYEAPPADAMRFSSGEFREALAWLLVASRLDTIPADPYVSISAPNVISERMTLVEAVQRANRRLESHIGPRVESMVKDLQA